MATEIPFPLVGVYRCLGVFRGVLNTSEELEPILLIQKKGVERTGVNVFGRFWGGEGNFNVHLTKDKNCEIFSSKITPELVALDLVGIYPV